MRSTATLTKTATTACTGDNKTIINWCHVQDKIYGKSDQIEQLLQAYRRQKVLYSSNIDGKPFSTLQNQPINTNELVLITGPSGVGKTALALTLQKRVEQDGGYFVRGKFEQPTDLFDASTDASTDGSTTASPGGCNKLAVDSPALHNGPIATALSQYASLLIKARGRGNTKGGDELASLQTALERELDPSERQVLAQSIPALQPILANQNVLAASSRNGWRGRLQGPDAEKYYCHILGKFVAAIRASLMDHPLVLLLDDLQWADSRSLELLKILMTRSSSKPTASNLLILGTVRSETMNHSISFHQQQQQQQAEENDEESITLVKTIQELQEKGVAITNVDVPNICEDAVRELVGDLLPCSDVESLSRSVYSQTGGNIFFIFQLMKFWEGEGMLGNRNIHDDDPEKSVRRPLDCENASVVALIAKKIHQLPLNVQEVLKMAACFGTNLSIRLLEEAGSVGMSPLEVEPALAVAHELGLVEQDTSIGTVSFVHDAVREAAYSLIAENARASLHLFVGRALWVWLTHEELEQHIFLVTNHICRGLHLIDDPTEKEGLARLCLRSGQKAARVSAFSQASSYYETGISLLGKNHWKRNYWLSLDLYNSAAEAEYYAGNLSRVDMLLNGVFEHARNLDDKLHAYNTQLNSQSSREDVNQAFQVGLDVLTQMGVAFPSKLQTIRTQVALHACLQKLRGMSDDNIMSLPIMQDNRHIMVMRMLNTLMMSASLVRQSLVLPMMIRIVNRTLQYGICGSSCIGFGYLGSYMGRRGHMDEGHRFVLLGLRIMERFDAKEWQSRLALRVYGEFYTTRHAIRESIKPLLAARRVGLVIGDIQSSVECAYLHCRVSLYAGEPLPVLLEEIRKCRRVCLQYGQKRADTLFCHNELLCLNFMGKADDPTTLSGQVVQEEEETIHASQVTHFDSAAWPLLMEHMLAVYFHEYEEAKEIAIRVIAMKKDGLVEVSLVTHQFLVGLNAAVLSRTDKSELRRAQRICKQLKRYQKISSENFRNKVDLLEAEIATAIGDEQVALSKYQKSIEAAELEGFVHEQALACEKAGYALQKWGKAADGGKYLKQACSLYEQWGALAKVIQIQQSITSD